MKRRRGYESSAGSRRPEDPRGRTDGCLRVQVQEVWHRVEVTCHMDERDAKRCAPSAAATGGPEAQRRLLVAAAGQVLTPVQAAPRAGPAWLAARGRAVEAPKKDDAAPASHAPRGATMIASGVPHGLRRGRRMGGGRSAACPACGLLRLRPRRRRRRGHRPAPSAAPRHPIREAP